MSGYDLSDIKVLVADDQASIRFLLRQILNQFGIREVLEAKDGTEAMSIMKTFTPDVIFTDYHMSPMDGLELVSMIRSGRTPASRFIPIIMLSSYTQMDHIQQARDMGITEFLAKPFSAKFVFARLRSVIENARPFVSTGNFFGPDRRRRVLDVPPDKDRRRDGYTPPHRAERRAPRSTA